VSISRRLFDLAKANLNALLDKAGGDAGLDELSDDELEAELERRRERRRRQDDERRAAERAAADARARAGQQKASAPPPLGASAPPPRGKTSPPPRAESRTRRGPLPSSLGGLSDKRLRELYAQLEVPFGAPFDEVKKSFRRLMRKYHPDLHIGNPQKHKTATQLTMSLTQAYNELEQHLVGGRRG
jgi:DnaJ-domain-containing protein 1